MTTPRRFTLLTTLLLPFAAFAASPLFSTPDATVYGVAGGDELGSAVSVVGDVDGDGYNDVLMGAFAANLSTGAAYLYMGSAGALSASPAVSLVGPGVSSSFGTSVAGAGDVNGDGYADVLIGAPGLDSRTGEFVLHLGGAAGLDPTPALTVRGPAAESIFAASVAGAGDVDGDGYDDVVVGASGMNVYTGAAYIYMGSASGLGATATVELLPPARVFGFGSSVAGVGDVNGDGYGDIVVCAMGTGGYLYEGSAAGISTVATALLTVPYTTDACRSVAGAGDMDGNGYADVIIGSDSVDSYAGEAYLFLGSASGPSTSPDVTWAGSGMMDQLGLSVGGAGDVNADGYDDAVIGGGGGMSAPGAVWVVLGGSTVATTFDTSLVGGMAGDYFGWSVAGGDVTGDGLSDLFVGAIQANRYTGTVSVYTHGTSGGGDTGTDTGGGDTGSGDTGGGDTGVVDSGDSGGGDTGGGDTGVVDSGDSGAEDSGSEDSGSEDSGPGDSGTDTAPDDSGSDDSGSDDSGSEDSGADSADDVSDDVPEDEKAPGCGCSTSQPGGVGALGLGVGLAALVSRRRVRRG